MVKSYETVIQLMVYMNKLLVSWKIIIYLLGSY